MSHEKNCKDKKNGCRLCSRVSNLLNIHARSCRADNCPVPQCSTLKNLNRYILLHAHLHIFCQIIIVFFIFYRQNALRQQQMDDRRRQQMNSEYGRPSSNQDND